MNFILGIVCLYLAYSRVMDAINPNRVSRTQVRLDSAFMGLVMALLGLAFLGFFGAQA